MIGLLREQKQIVPYACHSRPASSRTAIFALTAAFPLAT